VKELISNPAPTSSYRGDHHLRDDEYAARAGVSATGGALSAGAAVVHDLRVINPRHPERRHDASQ
jgi:hypothetical protein